MATKKLNLTDRSWLLVDRPDMPVHVAGLAVFSPPEHAGEGYLRTMMDGFRATRTFTRPFDLRLRQSPFSKLAPAWEVLPEEQIDLDYHVQHSTLPEPGGEHELGVLISHQHSRPLDLTRPPWEFHLIDGLTDGRFAMLLKVHHALIDGVGCVRRLIRMVTSDPEDRSGVPVWAVGAGGGRPRGRPPGPPPSSAKRIIHAARSTGGVVKTVAGFTVDAVRPSGRTAATVFGAPRSMLNGRITSQRRVATQTFELARIKRVAKAVEGTVNDVVMAMCSAALRRYLSEVGELPEWTLTAAAPVSRRDEGDNTGGNSFSLILINLHTDIADPVERLMAIIGSSAFAKAELAELPKPVADNFGVLMFAPFMAQLVTRLAGRTRPPCSLIVSNVPGPSGPLYVNGATLEHLYPVSPIFDGIGLNITVLSAGDRLNVGVVGCPDTAPHVQRAAIYQGEALSELERSLRLPDWSPRRS